MIVSKQPAVIDTKIAAAGTTILNSSQQHQQNHIHRILRITIVVEVVLLLMYMYIHNNISINLAVM